MAQGAGARRTWLGLFAGLAIGLLVLAVALYAARRPIAREVLTGWLRSKGVAAEAQVYAIGPSGFVGSIKVGDPARRDFEAERVEVGYRLKGLGVEVSQLRLVRPMVRATLRNGTLSVGQLDPLIAEFRARPPRPDLRSPRIEIARGTLRLATDYGPAEIIADATVDDARLSSLSAVARPMRLRTATADLTLGQADLAAVTRGDRLEVRLAAPIRRLVAPGLTLDAGQLNLNAALPYPDTERRRGEGRVVIDASLAGGRLEAGGQVLRDPAIDLAFTGEARGWINDLAVTGQGSANLSSAGLQTGGAQVRGLTLAAAFSDVAWTRAGGDAASAQVRLSGGAERLTAGELGLRQVAGALEGPVRFGRGGTALTLRGDAVARGQWQGLGPPGPLDSRDIAAVKRAARDFRILAPGITLAAGDGGLRMGLSRSLRLLPAAGGEARVTARTGANLLAPGGGDLTLAVAGGGLPRVDAEVLGLRFADGRTTAGLRIRTTLSIGPLEQGRIEASGRLTLADGVSFTGDRCASLAAPRLEFGENDVTDLAGQLCPGGAPMLRLAGGNWRIAGRAQAVSATAGFLQARITEGAGRIDFGQTGGRLDADLQITDAAVADAAPATRFNPLRMRGQAGLAGQIWTADLAFRTPTGQPVATARLTHDGATARGRVDIDTGQLSFAEGGLQPAELSPLAAALGSPATGQARFTGQIGWTPGGQTNAGQTSGGALTLSGLDFVSPAGRIENLSGQVAFSSLVPLIAAPGQILRAESLGALVPLTGITATFALDAGALTISGGEAAVGGGILRIETLEVPLGPDQPTRGVLVFERVQLHDLVEASPFGDKVDLDARVSGRMPFEAQGQRIRITGGELRAVEPGRLSIQRTALSAVQAEGAAEVVGPAAVATPPPSADTFTDFAYQAMENLAFDTLDATVATRPDDRLGVLFHIIGRHDPPQRQQIRLSLSDLIGRKFMNRKLPLPSDTGVNLTLDTTLNLDDLLRDFAEYRRLRGSGQVQP